MTIRVILADDQALLRATFKLLLDSTADIEVVGDAATGVEAVELARTARADLIVMDIRMPDMDGIEATRRITADEDLASVKILVLTTFEADDLVLEALRAGASGFLGKGVDPESLIAAIRTVAGGERLLSAAATRSLIERVIADPEPAPARVVPGLDDLTDREREITVLVAAGLSNTDARDRAQLVVFAYEAGLVPRH